MVVRVEVGAGVDQVLHHLGVPVLAARVDTRLAQLNNTQQNENKQNGKLNKKKKKTPIRKK